jgi:GYF domain 2
MTEWFYARGGQQNGPVTFEQLVDIASKGGLDAINDQVWNASMQNWTPAGQVPGIFSVLGIPDIPAINPSNPYAAPQSGWNDSLPSEFGLAEIAHGSEIIDPMVCITRAYEIFKRQFGNILLVGLVYIACAIGISFVFGMAEIMVTMMASPDNAPSSEQGTMVIVVTVISRVVQQVISIFLQLGMIRVGLALVSEKEISIGMLFGEGGKLLRAIGASILFGLAMVIGLVLLIVPGIYIAMRYGQFMNAIVERDLGIIEAFSYSESLTTNNRLNLFLLALLGILIVLVGLIPCGLGLIIAGPVVWLAGLVAYRWMQYGPDAAKDHPGTQIPMLKGM